MDSEDQHSPLQYVGENEVEQETILHDGEKENDTNGYSAYDVDELRLVNSLGADARGEDLDSGQPEHSPPLTGISPGRGSPPMSKGYGLKKWRRIRRDFNKEFSASLDDTSKVLKRGLSTSGNQTRPQVSPFETKQNSEGSIASENSSRNAGVWNGGSSSDFRFAVGPAFAAGADSENSEDRSSKSSVAARSPKTRHDLPAGLGHIREKNRLKNVSGKSLGNSAQRVQQGKGKIEGSKKHRGEKTDKENSPSSMESDSRSTNFPHVQNAFATISNGKQSRRSLNYDEENNVEAHTTAQVCEEVETHYRNENEGEIEEYSQGSLAADLSWEVKEEEDRDQNSSKEGDPLVESLFRLQSVQQALEKEVQKLGEIGVEVPSNFNYTDPEYCEPSRSDDFSSETTPTASSSLETQALNLKEEIKLLQCQLVEDRAVLEAKESRVAELEASFNISKSPEEESGSTKGLQHDEKLREIEIETEAFFRQKLEVEIQYLAITKTIERLKGAVVNQSTLFEEHETLNKVQAQIMTKCGEAESKAKMLNEKAKELEKYGGDILATEEALKMQSRVCKVSSCLFIQLILLLILLWLCVFQSSLRFGEVVPT